MTTVISIQSQVIHGRVGNSAAVLPLQMNGIEVAAVPTTLLSNHPGYPTLRGTILDDRLVADLLRGVDERGLTARADMLVTGYLGSVATGRRVAEYVRRAKAANPNLLYVCDPVIGDEDVGIYVDAELAGFFRDDLIPLADIITPNMFELALLAGHAIADRAALLAAAAGLAPRTVVTGGVPIRSAARGIELFAVAGDAAWRVATPRLDIRPPGTGDLFASLLVLAMAKRLSFPEAVAHAASAVFEVMEQTRDEGSAELSFKTAIPRFFCPLRPVQAVSIAASRGAAP